MSPPEGHVTLQLLVALEDVHPTVWRRLLVPGGVRLPKFHLMLQAGMGWSDSHLHQFRIGGVLWGMHFEDWVDDELDEATVTVARAVGATRQFFYDYDFGDGWGLEMAVESTWRTPQPLKHAVCLAGARACPPEDVGGAPGYEDFLRILGDPSDEEYERFRYWSGGDFDPEWFDLVERNIALQKIAIR
jgi:hypothetical protein